MEFQSYQSKQINPDRLRILSISAPNRGFQSYQSKQINPDTVDFSKIKVIAQNVSIVSIQTDQSRLESGFLLIFKEHYYVSIVSIQTDQSRHRLFALVGGAPYLSFNRINPNRSIPTATLRLYS